MVFLVFSNFSVTFSNVISRCNSAHFSAFTPVAGGSARGIDTLDAASGVMATALVQDGGELEDLLSRTAGPSPAVLQRAARPNPFRAKTDFPIGRQSFNVNRMMPMAQTHLMVTLTTIRSSLPVCFIVAVVSTPIVSMITPVLAATSCATSPAAPKIRLRHSRNSANEVTTAPPTSAIPATEVAVALGPSPSVLLVGVFPRPFWAAIPDVMGSPFWKDIGGVQPARIAAAIHDGAGLRL
jgi:hypothetical protein